MYIIGSRALNQFLPINCEGSDYDLVVSRDEADFLRMTADKVKEGEYSFQAVFGEHKFEVASEDLLNNGEVCRQYDSGEVMRLPHMDGFTAKVVSPVGLMLIKRSHLHRPVKWGKHIRDYHKIADHLKVQYLSMSDADYEEWEDEYLSLLQERTLLTKKVFGDRTPSLKKSNDSFFNDKVVKYYVHDDIHYATCYGEEPIYEKLKHKDKRDDAWCERDLWDELSHEDKVRCVREEGFTIALERKIIPHRKAGRHYSVKMAFDHAISRICTTLCGGKFRDFAIDNWPEIMNHDYDFVGKFDLAVTKGLKEIDRD